LLVQRCHGDGEIVVNDICCWGRLRQTDSLHQSSEALGKLIGLCIVLLVLENACLWRGCDVTFARASSAADIVAKADKIDKSAPLKALYVR
jgi:hypothetical protein